MFDRNILIALISHIVLKLCDIAFADRCDLRIDFCYRLRHIGIVRIPCHEFWLIDIRHVLAIIILIITESNGAHQISQDRHLLHCLRHACRCIWQSHKYQGYCRCRRPYF